MDIIEGIKQRKSIRHFKSDPVPKDVLYQILEAAGRSPSAMNTQPWEFVVLAGDVLNNIREENTRLLRAETPPQPEHKVVGWPNDGVFRKRQVDLAVELFKLMDIQREDKEKRAKWMERGFRFFEAPAAIILLSDRALSEAGPLMDLGAVMQSICLAALPFDLGTCIEDQGVMYPQTIRKYADIEESKKIMIAIAVGYPDWDFPANKLVSQRETTDNITTWCGI